MRKTMMIAGVVAATIGLTACGSSDVKASLHQYVGSLGAQPNVQVTFTGSVTGAGTTEAQKVLKDVSVKVSLSNPSGASLSSSKGTANTELNVLSGGSSFLDVREVDANLYFLLDVTKLASIPGVKIPQSEAAEVQLVLGGRWFELPKALLNSLLPKTHSTSASPSAADQAISAKVIDALSQVIDTSHYTTLANGGYSETGTLQSLENAIATAIPSIAHSSLTKKATTGTYTLTITTSGSTATGGSVSVTAPNGSKGDATVGLTATVTHASDPVVAPTGATTITPSLLHEFDPSAS